MTVEVCFECDIADCHHIRARRTAPPDVAQAARVLLADLAVNAKAKPLAEMIDAMHIDTHPSIALRGVCAFLRATADGGE